MNDLPEVEDLSKHPWRPHASIASDGDREHVLSSDCWCDPRIEVVPPKAGG